MKTNKYKKVSKKGRTQLVIKSMKGQSLNLREVEDMQNGSIPNVVQVNVEVRKGSFVLNYDITNYIPLEQYMHTIVNRTTFAQIILQILRTIQTMTEAYYNPQNLILEIDKVFINPSTDKVLFVFLPILYYNSNGSVRDFLIQLIYHTTFDGTEDASYVKDCLDILQKNMNFSAVELEEYLIRLIPKTENQAENKDIGGIFQKEAYDPFMESGKQESSFDDKVQTEGGKDNVVHNVVSRSTRMTESLSDTGSSDTGLLGAEMSYIKQLRTGKIYYLKEAETMLGKQQCEFEIIDNSAVSRQHAMIQKREGTFYLVDMKSTNGTKVNGQNIVPGEAVLLQDETRFELADEKFIFYK